ncbi:MAG TPA: penicillin-binding protein 1A [Candidatus Acidoferrales bacterium]|nr:penicillin-binding protein 1A [Candidatus Acidoferrales bacterium]
MPLRIKIFGWIAGTMLTLMMLGAAAAFVAYLQIAPQLPAVDTLRDFQFEIPLRIYSQDGKLMGEYGDQRREPIHFDQFPPLLIKAVLAAEDDRFFEHPGVDYQGLLRAVGRLLLTGEREQGGSTITMQVARNFFLSSEKTYERKLREILLAFRIERELSKEDILSLYLNKIYLGQRAYGMEAASRIYYGKSVWELSLAECATLAGLPKAPSRINPVANPTAALARRDYVLRRMAQLGMIDADQLQTALASPNTATLHNTVLELQAMYVAEMVRQELQSRLGSDIYRSGLIVHTTLDSGLQAEAELALRSGLEDYDRRHGYRGPEARWSADEPAQVHARRLSEIPEVGGLRAAVVLAVEPRSARVRIAGEGEADLDWDAMRWARPWLGPGRLGPLPTQATQVLKPGDVIRVRKVIDRWILSQVPDVQGALVSISPRDGRILALVGGFDFVKSAFNRATQARRQPGSSFKPFLYAAAFDNGFTPASIINDAPIEYAQGANGEIWRPENYTGRFYGPTTLREGLVHSRNLVSVRLLEQLGVRQAVRYVERFGFPMQHVPADLSLSLGTAELTPLELARGYAVFASGGYLLTPYLIARVEDHEGRLLYARTPELACEECGGAPSQPRAPAPSWLVDHPPQPLGGPDFVPEPIRSAPRVMDVRTSYLMTSLMQDVILRGTGRRAARLNRPDIAGKTGTTNGLMDAWFAGYTPDLVTVTWVGFDQMRSLGPGESGGATATPIWANYMEQALKNVPIRPIQPPPGVLAVWISSETGRQTAPGDAAGRYEYFRSDMLPPAAPDPETVDPMPGEASVRQEELRDLF